MHEQQMSHNDDDSSKTVGCKLQLRHVAQHYKAMMHHPMNSHVNIACLNITLCTAFADMCVFVL